MDDSNVMTSWSDSPSTRGTSDLIYSCFFTMVACVWSTQHLNVPARRDRTLTLEKLKWAIINLVLPELMLAMAISDSYRSHEHLRRLRACVSTHPEAMGGWVVEGEIWSEKILAPIRWWNVMMTARRGDVEIVDESGSETANVVMEALPTEITGISVDGKPKVWTFVHSTYLNMGGLHVRADNPKRPGRKMTSVVYTSLMDPEDDIFDYSHSPLKRLSITRDEILDKDKGDGFTKSITVIQIIWFVVSIIARKLHNLPTSQLEILTLAFALLAVAIYLVLWNKPKGIVVPTTIDLERFSDDASKARKIMKRLRRERQHGNGLRAACNRFVDEGAPVPYIFIAAIMVVFGGLHCLAWNFAFPSTIERDIWRTASLVTASAPVFVQLLAVIFLGITDLLDLPPFIGAMINATPWLGITIYVIGRLALIGIAFSSLRLVPAGVYVTTWSKYLPNVQ